MASGTTTIDRLIASEVIGDGSGLTVGTGNQDTIIDGQAMTFRLNGTTKLQLSSTGIQTNNIQAISGVLTVGTLTVNGSTLSLDSGVLINNTTDGSDNKVMQIAGGGSASTTRGAYIQLFGNEYTGEGGKLKLQSGNNATLELNAGSGPIRSSSRMYFSEGGTTYIPFLASSQAPSNAYSGYLIVKFTNVSPSGFANFKIAGYQYSGVGGWEVNITAYMYAASGWYFPRAQITGQAPFNPSQVQFFDECPNNYTFYIVIGQTSWSFAHAVLKDMDIHNSGLNNFFDPNNTYIYWQTDLSGIPTGDVNSSYARPHALYYDNPSNTTQLHVRGTSLNIYNAQTYSLLASVSESGDVGITGNLGVSNIFMDNQVTTAPFSASSYKSIHTTKGQFLFGDSSTDSYLFGGGYFTGSSHIQGNANRFFTRVQLQAATSLSGYMFSLARYGSLTGAAGSTQNNGVTTFGVLANGCLVSNTLVSAVTVTTSNTPVLDFSGKPDGVYMVSARGRGSASSIIWGVWLVAKRSSPEQVFSLTTLGSNGLTANVTNPVNTFKLAIASGSEEILTSALFLASGFA